ncbi:hypothetical protein KX816_14725 [Sphingosinicellaceae bacterium]|nr:hypothetical protein KX816_14725 [Sphingosinicellaceae bacterium]
MADSPILLSSLLADTRGAVDEVVHAKAAERPDAALLGKALTRLGDAVDGGVRKACNKDLVGLLVEGWGKAMELRGYGDPAKYPPPHTTRMFVGKHPMKVSVDPELTLSIGTLKFPLEFIVEFVATVNAVRLTIVDGAITDVDIGTLEVGAKLRWGTTEVPLPLKTREIKLPGHFGITPPFAIPH